MTSPDSAITTSQASFFRDKARFDHVETTVIRDLAARASPSPVSDTGTGAFVLAHAGS